MKVTIYDVAKKAGVSIATVSKVINNTGNMRETTRKKIIETIEEMNYRPNQMASALSGKGTKTFGLLVPDISNPFFSAIARRIEDCAYEQGMTVIICSTDENAEKEKKYVDVLQGKQVDGLILASTFNDKSVFHELIEGDIPLVMLAYDDSMLDISNVSVDDFKGGYIATSHLITKDHRNIAVIAENTQSSRLRIFGYREAHAVQGIQTNDKYIFSKKASIENGKECFEEIVQQKDIDRPTAIFACNDLLAIGVIQGATEKGIRIPEDIAVIGFDNTILASTTVPGLTTISQPIEEMGKKIVDVLIDEIKGKKDVKKRILFNPKLIVRGTT